MSTSPKPQGFGRGRSSQFMWQGAQRNHAQFLQPRLSRGSWTKGKWCPHSVPGCTTPSPHRGLSMEQTTWFWLGSIGISRVSVLHIDSRTLVRWLPRGAKYKSWLPVICHDYEPVVCHFEHGPLWGEAAHSIVGLVFILFAAKLIHNLYAKLNYVDYWF